MLLRVIVIALVFAGLGAQSGSAAESPDRPGVPAFTEGGDWVGPAVSGIANVEQAKQWVRLPPINLVAWNYTAGGGIDNRCINYRPFKSKTIYRATAFIRSDPGAPEPYGYSDESTVRTVAFGSIPVEATVQLRQPRDSENLPVGIEIVQETGIYCDDDDLKPYPDIDLPDGSPRNARNAPASITGEMEVVVRGIKVDGVALQLKGNCRTSKPGKLDVTSRDHYTMSPDNLIPGVQPSPQNRMTTPYLSIANGGLAFGTADIPAFAGCITKSGEDVSRLLTATVSGPDNPITMRTDGLVAGCKDKPINLPCGDFPLPGLPLPSR